MKSPFIMHMLVALVWLFLSGNTSLGNFFLALVLTFILLALFRKPLHCEDYVRRTFAFFVFLKTLMTEIVSSNLRISRVVFHRNASREEGAFVPYDVAGLNERELLLVSLCIGLSPGTMVANRSDDGNLLILHVFAAGTAEEVQKRVDATIKSGILSFTR
ncbi:MAG: Na+/H+ antiporter subunit E [Luteolibacter sp.]